MKVLLFAALVLSSVSTVAAAPPPEGEDLVGTRAPPFELKQWVRSSPIEIEDLHGKVVLVRWWTDGCPFCSTSAPALN
jgi:hypothetical protein